MESTAISSSDVQCAKFETVKDLFVLFGME